jgi:putative acetyltransferase
MTRQSSPAKKKLTITIRGIESDDWEDSAEILYSGNVVYYTLQLPFLSRDMVRERVENIPAHLSMLVAVVDEHVVGQLGLERKSGRQAHVGRLGMMVHADYQGCGVGSALLGAAVDLGENWLDLSRIELEVYTDNAAGIALYQKFGFEIEGTLQDYAFRDGQYVDSYLMARIRDENDA